MVFHRGAAPDTSRVQARRIHQALIP
jgi:hypothetical protein